MANLTQGNRFVHQFLEEDLVVAPNLAPTNGRIGPLEAPGLGVRTWAEVGGRHFGSSGEEQ